VPGQPAQRNPAADRDAAAVDGWQELTVANPTFLLERLGSECTDLQGLRELTVNGLAVDVALAENRSEVLGARDALQAIQQTHWQIHKAHHDYLHAAEDRRQLAADLGGIIRTLLDELVAAGSSEPEARNANVGTLAAAQPWDVARVDAGGDPIEEMLALSLDCAQKIQVLARSSCDRVIQRSPRPRCCTRAT
jgi:hypothetical protein